MKFRIAFIFFFLMGIAPTAFATTPCDILVEGNTHYRAQDFEQALDVYLMVEQVDQLGRAECTGSIYASIATIYLVQANNAFSSNAVLAANLYRNAAKYNRAFAHAVACRIGDCEAAESFWDPQSLWQQ